MKYIAVALLAIITTHTIYADPVSPSEYGAIDNLRGTGDELIFMEDVSLTPVQSFRITSEAGFITSKSYYDANGKVLNLHQLGYPYYYYSRINMPMEITFGITKNMEIGVRVPFVAIRDSIDFGLNSFGGRENMGLGEPLAKFRFQVFKNIFNKGNLIFGFGIKIPMKSTMKNHHWVPERQVFR